LTATYSIIVLHHTYMLWQEIGFPTFYETIKD